MENLSYYSKQIERRNKIGRTIMILGFVLFSTSVIAQTISIQGVLRDPNGRSVDDGAYSVAFRIYDVATGGTALWTDTYANLTTKHGVFQANLGEQTTLDGLAFDTQYYVGVTVENYAEMAPRIALTIYPYSKAILGQNNKFPSTGNVEINQDNLVINEGDLEIKGANGRLVFNDGTSLNSANFGGPAGSLANPTSAVINADNDADGSGAINFQTGGVTRASIANDGHAYFNGGLNATSLISSGTYNASQGILSLYGPDAASASGGQLNLFTSDTRTTEKWFFQPNENNLVLGHETGGAFPAVATFSSTDADFDVHVNAKTGKINVGANDATGGSLSLFGFGSGSAQGGKIDFFKAADHDGDGSPTASEYWFMEATNDDFRIGNVWSNNDVMFFDGTSNNIGIGHANPLIDLAVGDSDTGIDWIADGKFYLMSNNSVSLTINNNGNIGIGASATAPTEAKLVIRDSPSLGHNVTYAYSSSAGSASSIQDWPAENGNDPSFFAPFSVWADGNYGGLGFVVFSDERIKDVVGRSNNGEDLELLERINIRDYSFIDKVKYGDKVEKKVIAQEIAEIYPQAVLLSTSVVPNIYEVPKKISFTNGSLTIKLNKAHSLKSGDKVQCFIEDETHILDVEEVDGDKTFTVSFDRAPEHIFVYGQEVDDFHTVDYDAISMLNVSATQELAKRSEAQEERIATLEAENAELKQKLELLNALEAKVEALLKSEKKKEGLLLGQN